MVEFGSARGSGIGMANVSERLEVLYGDSARMTIDSREGKGTLVRIRLPLLQAMGAVPENFYEERASTRR
jgi:sensor histidine kinase YesM